MLLIIRNTKRALFVLLLAGGSVTPAIAASQGSLGSTSTGSATISVTKSVQAQISDLEDMTLASWSVGDGAVTLSTDVCVYSSTGSYKVTASGSGIANAFTIASGASLILYTLKWNDDGVGTLANSGTTLLTGIQSTTFSNADTSSATCSGGGANDTARLIVDISSLAMTAAVSSAVAYTGTVTVLITPI